MRKSTRYVGLDVHADTIAVAVAEGRKKVHSLGIIANTPAAIRKLVKKLGPPNTLRVCYEAGPTGYPLYWQLTRLGVACEVVAPLLLPPTPGDRIKTDRRDAEKLARCHRSGDLTAIWVPDAAHEALRDLVRARAAAKGDEKRAKQRLLQYLLRNGRRHPKQSRAWTHRWWSWVRELEFEYAAQNATHQDHISEIQRQEQRVASLDAAIELAIADAPEHMRAVIEALQSLRGVAKLTAVTIVTEVGTFTRFEKAPELMSYTGLVASERSSGKTRRQGRITRAGNSNLRRILVEAAWHYRHRPWLNARIKQVHQGQSSEVIEMAWKAQGRLNRRYRQLMARHKPAGKTVTALARELTGFIWAIGRHVESTTAATTTKLPRRASC
ncbi:MAG: IS110 family transposase [Gammaproteobacteria bacterium]|nr:IS110 family transposase [Gammaproteobacteria bacterium]